MKILLIKASLFTENDRVDLIKALGDCIVLRVDIENNIEIYNLEP